MFSANTSNNTIDYESPGARESYRQVCESRRYCGTGTRCPLAAGDTRGR